jgi:hypothetical protein
MCCVRLEISSCYTWYDLYATGWNMRMTCIVFYVMRYLSLFPTITKLRQTSFVIFLFQSLSLPYFLLVLFGLTLSTATAFFLFSLFMHRVSEQLNFHSNVPYFGQNQCRFRNTYFVCKKLHTCYFKGKNFIYDN